MNTSLKRIVAGAAVAALTSPILMFAAVPAVVPTISPVDAPGAPPGTPTSVNAFLAILVTILGYVQALFWILAVAMGIYAAFLYLTARGNAETIEKANQMLIYVVVAIIVAILAYAIPKIVSTTITTP